MIFQKVKIVYNNIVLVNCIFGYAVTRINFKQL